MPGLEPMGWAVLGCGRVAERRFAPAFARIDDAKLIAFCSRDAAKAEAYADRHGAERFYGSLDELLADKDVDIIYVATPNALHSQQAIRCLQAGKHVLVDKPMATSSQAAGAMIDTAKKRRRLLGVLQQQRFHPANMHLIRLCDEGELGRLNLLRVQTGIWYPPTRSWRGVLDLSGGGVVMDLAPHALDLMIEVAGNVVAVDARTRTLEFKGEVEDFCSAWLEFDSGAVGLLELSYCAHAYGGRVEAYGDKGTYTVDGSMQAAGTYTTWFRKGDAAEPMQQHVSTIDCYQAAIEDFNDAVRNRKDPSIDMVDGLRVIEVVEAIYRSSIDARTTPVERQRIDTRKTHR